MKKTFVKIAVASVLALSFTFVGCGGDQQQQRQPANAPAAAKEDMVKRVFKPEDFVNKTFAILSGSSFDAVARETIGASSIRYYNTPAECMEAVKNGETAATLLEESVARNFAAQNPELIVLQPPVDIENYAYIFPKSDEGKLRDEFNAFLAQKRTDGTYEEMIKRWVDTPNSPPMPEITLNPTKGKTLTFATSDSDEPFSFRTSEGRLEGFDIELAIRFVQANGYDIDIRIMEFPDIIPAIHAGRLDFASNLITITEDRKLFLDFSEPYYYEGTVVLARK